MAEWKSVLKADAADWLLEEDNPSVRYFTLIDLLEKPHNDPEVLETKKAIMTEGLVPKIFAKINSGGYWETPISFYTAKYKGTVWQLIIIAELGANPTDERVKKACYKDERMKEAVDLVISKQEASGRWRLEITFNGRFQANIERKGEESKWITLNALKALKRYYN